MNVVVVGAGGFVGSAIAAEASRAGHTVQRLPHPHTPCPYVEGAPPSDALRQWLRSHAAQHDRIVDQLRGTDVLVNAAGLARPASSDRGALWAANALLPGLLAELTSRAGVRRLIHVSSAAVQGRRDPLDESEVLEPVTPYGESKAAGERLLSESALAARSELVIYRPTSVLAASRSITRQLVRLASKRFVPVAGCGNAAVPVCLLENVAAGINHLIDVTTAPPVVLQPWEGVSTKMLLEMFAEAPTFVSVPESLVRVATGLGHAVGRGVPIVAAGARRLELFAFGQGQQAVALEQSGYVRPVGLEGYRALPGLVLAGLSRDASAQ